MDWALFVDILAMPKKANTPPKANYSKCCWYHRNNGHSIEECNVLKDYIEDLIKLGHLKDFIHKPQSYRPHNLYKQEWSRGKDQEHASHSKRRISQSYSREREEKPLDQPRWVINTIVGGFTGEGATASTWKRHLWQVWWLTWSPLIKHLVCLISPSRHMTLERSTQFKTTLVDQGSSTNILFWNTFKKMEIPESEILLHDDPLLNFTSEHVRTKESIWLYTKFGNVGPSQKD